jgi:hypothetical protein
MQERKSKFTVSGVKGEARKVPEYDHFDDIKVAAI